MQLHPGRSAVYLLRAAIFVVGLGLALSQPAVVAWGGAILVGLYLARAATLTSVTQIRSAGFEMLWQTSSKYLRTQRGSPKTVMAEVRNRDARAVRFTGLRAVHSPSVLVKVNPTSGEVPAGGRLKVTLTVTTRRVGRHALHGLNLQVRGGPGLHEVPLSFSNPLGLLVMPASRAMPSRSPIGGGIQLTSRNGLTSRGRRGDYDLRELRDYQPGDPLKRIAWRASAKRGALVTKEFNNSERELVWLVLDASSELWSGTPGDAPLDAAIDTVARLATSHIGVGDSVGLMIIGAGTLTEVRADKGAHQAHRLHQALALDTHTYDARRSAWDDHQVANRVREHMRQLTNNGTRRVNDVSTEALAQNAQLLYNARAPFSVDNPGGHDERDATLRRYLAGFGIESPPRVEPERPATDLRLVAALRKLVSNKPRPTRVVVASPLPFPDERPELVTGLRELIGRRTRLEWLVVSENAGAEAPATSSARLAHQAAQLRADTRAISGFDCLRQLKIRPLFFRRHGRSVAKALPSASTLVG